MTATADAAYRDVAARRERVLFDLARRDKSDVAGTWRAITEASATAVDVERVGIWRLLDGGRALVCEDQFTRSTSAHTAGEVVTARDFPVYFRALQENRVIAAHDACTDSRTSELASAYLIPHGIGAMMDVPIWHRGRGFGVLCHEHVGPPRRWSSVDETFAANVSDLVSLSLEAGESHEAERRWHAVVDAIVEAVFVMDAEGHLNDMNPAAARMMELAGGGTTLAERQKLIEFRDLTGRIIAPERTAGARSIRGEVIQGEIIQAFFKRTGVRRSYRVSSAPIRDTAGIQSVVAVLSDVTEEVYVERLKRELLAALAHEFKTPVTVIKGYAQHLTRTHEAPSTPMLGAIERAANRLQRLIDDLVEVSGLVLGRLVLTLEPVEITGVVRSLVGRLGHPEGGRRIRLTAPQPALVLADRPRLEQVVARLCDNALRYSSPDSDVDIAVVVEAPSVTVSVRDSGIGIPAEVQEHVFEPFFRAHAGTPDDVGGLGIGLYLAREIALRHGGEIWFESAVGQGTTFHLRLPRVQSHE